MRGLIDYHAHVIPGIDDGAADADMAIAMLQESRRQGVHTVVATPHFYADRYSPDEWLAARDRRFMELQEAMKTAELDVRVLRGAEVGYFPGISQAEDAARFAIEEMGMLMVEMPYAGWTESEVRELIDFSHELAGSAGTGSQIRVLLAHVDRYVDFQDRSVFHAHNVFEELHRHDIQMQINTAAFMSRHVRRTALEMIRKGYVRYIGTDMHNMTDKPPNLDKIRYPEGIQAAGEADEQSAGEADEHTAEKAGEE